MDAHTDTSTFSVESHGPMATAMRGTLELLVPHGSVSEIRILNTRQGTVSGYFDDLDLMAAAAAQWDGNATGVFFTLNPVTSDLLARSSNRLKPYSRFTTRDAEITGRVWLPIDVDPIRPRGISSNTAEHQAALEQAKKIRDYLAERGWPAPIFADSGNGGHLLYRIKQTNDASTTDLINRCLNSIAFRFSDDVVSIDTAVGNAARIWKLYGTLACKGDSLPDRPHRRSQVLSAPACLDEVNEVQLEALAAESPSSKLSVGNGIDVDRWLEDRGLSGVLKVPWQGGFKYVFDECPWNAEHTNRSAYIVQFSSGAIAAGCHHNSCSDNDWHALRDQFEPGWRERRNNAQTHTDAPGPSDDGWLAPAPLPAPHPAVPRLSVDLLPEPFRGWVADIAERVNVPLEFVAAPAIVAAGSLVGRGVGIRPKSCDDWTVVPNLWGGVVGPPGVMKSAAIAEATRPLRLLAIEAGKQFEQSRAKHENLRAILEIRLKAAHEQGKAAAKSNDEKKLESIREEMLTIQQEIEQTEITERRFQTQDATTEKIAELLRKNPRGILINRDELAGWLRTLDKPGREGDREFYLEAWNGSGGFTYDRIGRGTIHVPAVTLSVLGGIQPGKLRSYINASLADDAGNDGLLQRVQLLVWPDDLGEWRNVDRWPDQLAKKRAFSVYSGLSVVDAELMGAAKDQCSDVPAFRFSPEAQELFDEWRSELELRLRSPEAAETPAFTAHLAKYRSLMPSLALIFSLIEMLDRNDATTCVSLESAKLAAGWCEFLEIHAKKVYAKELQTGVSAALALAGKIKGGAASHGMSIRDISQREWSGLTSPSLVHEGVDVLERHGWLRRTTVPTGGRPSGIIHIHPQLRKP